MNNFHYIWLILFLIVYTAQKISAKEHDTVRIYFELDKHDIEKARFTLDSISTLNDILAIKVIGYTDYLGTDAYNMNLARKRANNVKDYLDTKFPSILISAIGRGELASVNERPLGEPEHRRADIILTKSETEVNTKSIEENKETTPGGLENISEMDVGESLVLRSMNFVGGSHFLLPESEPQLIELFNALKQNPTLKIEIEGHVCCTAKGEDGYDYDSRNFFLSVNRARYIYEQLISMGIEKTRLKYKGFGGSNPKIWPEITEEDKTKNRRVEIRILSK